MRFPTLIFSSPVIVGEHVFLDARKSFATPDEGGMTELNMQTEATPIIDVLNFDKRGLLYNYSSAGNKSVVISVVTSLGSTSKTYQVPVVTLESLNLFSNDSDLSELEHDIMSYLPMEKSSFNTFHYAAQKHILDELKKENIRRSNGTMFTAADIADIEEVRRWSIHMTLSLIFGSMINEKDDIYLAKSEDYFKRAISLSSVASLKLKDSTTSSTEEIILNRTSGVLRRR